MKRGWTLHEMLISLSVMGGVLGLVAHQATTQRRLYAGIQQATVARENRAQVHAIAERILWSVAPQAGDVAVALDSALQLRAEIASSVVCASASGSVTLVAPSIERGNVLAGAVDTPEAGDQLAALFHDSTGTTWLTFHVAAPPADAACGRFPMERGWTLALVEQIAVPEGAAVRVLRPLRLSVYKASDSRWYLGAKEWNGAANRFNSIQPVAGPHAPYAEDPWRSGLAFIYRDRAGAMLAPPIEAGRMASVSIVARAPGPVADSGAVTIALRNVR